MKPASQRPAAAGDNVRQDQPEPTGARRVSLEEFHAECKAQGVPGHLDIALVCPMCRSVQSARDLISAGAGASMDEVERYVGFSCVGRFTGAPGAKRRKPAAGHIGCDWTLGGLFQLHELEVVTPDGKLHPRFALASPEVAQAHARRPDRALT